MTGGSLVEYGFRFLGRDDDSVFAFCFYSQESEIGTNKARF